MEGKSEVARLMAAIEAEYEAGQQAMHGSALGIAQHTFITRRMENMTHRINELRALVGGEVADELMREWDNQS